MARNNVKEEEKYVLLDFNIRRNREEARGRRVYVYKCVCCDEDQVRRKKQMIFRLAFSPKPSSDSLTSRF